jgi:hypothetical protein
MNTKKILIIVGVVSLIGCIITLVVVNYVFKMGIARYLSQDPVKDPEFSTRNFDSNNSFQPVAELVLPGEWDRLTRPSFESVKVINNHAYALAWGGNIYVYDVEHLGNNNSFKSYNDPVSMLTVKNDRGLEKVDQYLYVFGEEGIEIVDTQNPERLKIVSSISDLAVNSLVLSNEYLIAAGNKQVFIYKLINSFTPELLTRLRIGEDINSENVIAYSAAIHENILYVSTFFYYTDIGMLLYDIADISNPVFIGLIEGELAHHSLIVENKLVQCSSEHILLWSLENPSKPILLSTIDAVGNVCQLVDNNFLITDGKVVKISDESLQVESEFGESDNTGFPQGSDLDSNHIFITQEYRILILINNTE